MRIEMAQYILPFLAAFIGISLFVVNVWQHWPETKRGDPGPFLLFLVSLLCTAYGVERLTYSAQFAERLDRIDQELRLHDSATFTDNPDEIWFGIKELMTGMQYRIRTVQSGDRRNTIPDGFKDLRDRVAARLIEMKQRHLGVKFQIVLVFEGKRAPSSLPKLNKSIRMD